MLKYLFFVFILSSIFVQNACTYNKYKEEINPIDTGKNSICDTCPISYNAQIKYLINRRCSKGGNGDQSCHFGVDAGSRDFSTYQGLTGSQYYKNKILPSIQHQSGTVPMPYKNPKLPNAEIDSIKIWVNKGFPEN